MSNSTGSDRDRAGPTTAAHSLRELIELAGGLGRSIEEFERRVLEPFGLSDGDYAVLSCLRAAGAPYRSSPTYLMRELGRSSGGLTKLLTRIETNRLITREANPEDGRSLLVRLSRRGLELATRVDRAFVSAAANRLDGLSAKQIQAIRERMRELQECLDREE